MLSLSLERGCIAFNLWRADLPPEIDYDQLFARLEQHINLVNGHKSHLPLRAFRDDIGNQILIVMRTGRVQFRITTEVPKDQREQTANRLFDLLSVVLDEMGACNAW